MSGQTAAKSRAKTIEKLTNRQIAGLTQADYINISHNDECWDKWYKTKVIEDVWPLLQATREELRTTGSIFRNPLQLKQRFESLALPSYPMKQCSEERVVYLELVNEPKEAREEHITFWLDVKMLPKEWKPANLEEAQRIFTDPIEFQCTVGYSGETWEQTPYESLVQEDYAKFADWEDGVLDNSLAMCRVHYNVYPPEDTLRTDNDAWGMRWKKKNMKNMEIGFCKLINDLSYAGSEAPSRIIVCIPRSGRPLVKEWGPKMAPHATFFVHSQPEEICLSKYYFRLNCDGREDQRFKKWTWRTAGFFGVANLKARIRGRYKQEESFIATPYSQEPVTLPIDETWTREGNTVTCVVSYQGNELYRCPCPTNVSFEQNRAQVFPLGNVNEHLQHLLDEAGAVRVTGGTISTNIRFDTLDPVFSKSLLSYFADSKSFQTEEDRALKRREALSNFADGFSLY